MTTITETRDGPVVNGEYQVNFDGTLAVDGIPFGNAPFDASDLFGTTAAVSLATQYTGEFINAPSFLLPPAGDPNSYAYFQKYSNFATDVRSIDVNIDGATGYDPDTGQDYSYSLSSVDPTVIIGGDRTALTGRFQTTSNTGPIIFGKISGNAVLLNGQIETPSPFPNSSYGSPFALQYQIFAEETTRLDENGLVTPTVSVTEGINMNGSTIRNVANGVAAGDAVNKAQLDAEASARVAGDTALSGQIAAEAASRQAGDAVLGGMLVTEGQARAAADLQLSQRIDVESSAREALSGALANESSARIAADMQLSSRVDALGGRLDQIDSRLDRIEDHVVSGTAVAVAMGGAAFLPDMKFNLTANVATYGGAHAGAVQMGALINPHVALNAGVATGFNRGGRTAARAGFTIGW